MTEIEPPIEGPDAVHVLGHDVDDRAWLLFIDHPKWPHLCIATCRLADDTAPTWERLTDGTEDFIATDFFITPELAHAVRAQIARGDTVPALPTTATIGPHTTEGPYVAHVLAHDVGDRAWLLFIDHPEWAHLCIATCESADDTAPTWEKLTDTGDFIATDFYITPELAHAVRAQIARTGAGAASAVALATVATVGPRVTTTTAKHTTALPAAAPGASLDAPALEL